MKGGQPVAGFAIELLLQGKHDGTRQTTDAAGCATFRVARPGLWLLRGTEVRRSSRADADWESDFTTLTVVVR